MRRCGHRAGHCWAEQCAKLGIGARVQREGAGAGCRVGRAARPRTRDRRREGDGHGARPPMAKGQNGVRKKRKRETFFIFWFLQTCSKFKLDLNSKPLNSNPTLSQKPKYLGMNATIMLLDLILILISQKLLFNLI